MRRMGGAALLVATLMVSIPAAAQSFEEIDAISDASASEEGGIALANEQTERGELLEALATLERVLAQFPESAEARFNHAMLLCWVDDPQGALAEFERLDEEDYAPGVLEQAIDTCRSVTEQTDEPGPVADEGP